MSHYTGPVPAADSKPDWRTDALCREEDPELFFPKGYDGPWQLAIAEAKSVCRRCPVVEQCLQFALAEDIPSGIFGGLTDKERASLRRSVRRGNTAPEEVNDKAASARQTRRPQTLQALFDDNTVRLFDGHLAWTGKAQAWFEGRAYSPKKLAFIVDRGREPEGRVLNDCGNSECVLPAHVADDAERMRCGTRAGYQRHLRQGTEICEPCRQANNDANNRLLRTGTTKAAA